MLRNDEYHSPGTVFLTDNGSLRPAATLRLRRLAAALSRTTGRRVEPVSLLHSHKVPAEYLEGRPAEILEPALRERAKRGERNFLVTPLFFGLSRALTDYLPKRVAHLRNEFGELNVDVAPPLVDPEPPEDLRVARILIDGVLAVRETGERQAVILVDHGSPEPKVTAVRNLVASRLREGLGNRVERVEAASMERREGPEYAFNEPLLENLLGRPGFDRGRVIVAMMFLLPGRHAGPDGDVARICRRAEAAHPGLETVMTSLVGEHEGLLEILADRVRSPDREPPREPARRFIV